MTSTTFVSSFNSQSQNTRSYTNEYKQEQLTDYCHTFCVLVFLSLKMSNLKWFGMFENCRKINILHEYFDSYCHVRLFFFPQLSIPISVEGFVAHFPLLTVSQPEHWRHIINLSKPLKYMKFTSSSSSFFSRGFHDMIWSLKS